MRHGRITTVEHHEQTAREGTGREVALAVLFSIGVDTDLTRQQE